MSLHPSAAESSFCTDRKRIKIGEQLIALFFSTILAMIQVIEF